MKILLACVAIFALSACNEESTKDVQIPKKVTEAPCSADAMTMDMLEQLLEDAFSKVDMRMVEQMEETGYAEDSSLYNVYSQSRRFLSPDCDAEEIAFATTVLWLSKHHDTMELCWWKASTSLGRLMILVFELGGASSEELRMTSCPEFPTELFREEERRVRQREKEWVLSHHSEIHAMLGRLMKKIIANKTAQLWYRPRN